MPPDQEGLSIAVIGLPQFVCGVDIVEFDTFSRALQHGGEYFLRHIYTEAELDFCRGRVPQLAARFAAKEATSKALGTGLRGISWNDIEVLSTQEGCPYVSLYRRAAHKAKYMGLYNWRISLSHSEHLAIALVIASQTEQAYRDASSNIGGEARETGKQIDTLTSSEDSYHERYDTKTRSA